MIDQLKVCANVGGGTDQGLSVRRHGKFGFDGLKHLKLVLPTQFKVSKTHQSPRSTHPHHRKVNIVLVGLDVTILYIKRMSEGKVFVVEKLCNNLEREN